MGRVKRKCCRTSPRCAGCPVLVAARARLGERPCATATALLIEEVLVGRPPRQLPPAVEQALDELAAARSARRFERRSPLPLP